VDEPLLLAGRSDEQRILGDTIRDAAEGRPRAVFVHGEAGVGKTRLVRHICNQAAAQGAAVLWGQCVYFGSVDSPYLPLVRALDGWATSADPQELEQVLSTVDGAEELLPSLSGYSARYPRLLPVIEALILAIAVRRPTVLVVDDVQWADLASRDALAYLVAGFRDQQLALLTTHRDEELVSGHPMHRWLADLKRLPAVTGLRLDRLTRDETEQQLTLLLHGNPQPRLLADVVRRSDGNPYLSELLVKGLRSTDEQLPQDLPVELAEALLAAWHRLSPPARGLAQLLAVAGRPTTVADLIRVATIQGLPEATARAALEEATDQRILVAQGRATCWFRHPLLAEVLGDTLPPGAAIPVHAAWATTLERASSTGIDEVRRQGDLALHYEAANDLAAGLRASLQAAALAREIRAPQEAAVHLRRAAGLWPGVHRDHPDPAGEVRLMEDLARASHLIGDGEASIAAWSRAIELVDETADPLKASRLLVEWSDVAVELARFNAPPLDVALRAVQLSEAFPDSSECAIALSTLGFCEAWGNQPHSAQPHALAALRAAERSGDNEALCSAYGVLAFINRREGGVFTREAERFAQLSGDPELIASAALTRYHHLRCHGDVEGAIRAASGGLQVALDAGASHGAVRLARCLARHLLLSGRLSDSEAVIREGLSLVGVPNAVAGIRLEAALLASRRGEVAFAQMHLERAAELIPNLDSRPGLMAPPIVAEYLIARRQPEPALDLLTRTLPVHAVDPRIADEMLMCGARAAAEMAQEARDLHEGERAATAIRLLDELVAARSSHPAAAFATLVPEDLVQPAMAALFVAESKRCRGESRTSTAWGEAVSLCAAAGMRWEQMTSAWRWSQALLGEGARPSVVAPTLRTVYQFATASEARPLQRHAFELASLGKISLEEPAGLSDQVAQPAAFAGLTKRELEVLSYLVAGRTYAEIAVALFISEKTVSVHVSNLLRKTGTSSRQEVSALALRLRESADQTSEWRSSGAT
jgi:DNA-binding CsgD family transcriptional regulator